MRSRLVTRKREAEGCSLPEAYVMAEIVGELAGDEKGEVVGERARDDIADTFSVKWLCRVACSTMGQRGDRKEVDGKNILFNPLIYTSWRARQSTG